MCKIFGGGGGDFGIWMIVLVVVFLCLIVFEVVLYG